MVWMWEDGHTCCSIGRFLVESSCFLLRGLLVFVSSALCPYSCNTTTEYLQFKLFADVETSAESIVVVLALPLLNPQSPENKPNHA